VTPRRLEPWLLLPHEALVVDDFERLVEGGLVVAGVVSERSRVLEQDFVVERELSRRSRFLRRISARSIPSSLAAKSRSRSITNTPCWRPAPRTGVTMVLFVKTAVNSLS